MEMTFKVLVRMSKYRKSRLLRRIIQLNLVTLYCRHSVIKKNKYYSWKIHFALCLTHLKIPHMKNFKSSI